MATKDNNLSYRFLPGSASILLVGDHAGRETSEEWGFLGISEKCWDHHIAYDIGVSGLGAILSEKLSAPFVEQRFSRLLLDCNRNVERNDRIPAESDGVQIHKNMNLSKEDVAARVERIFQPYQERIATELDHMMEENQVLFVSLHSFTPALKDGVKRIWDMGFLFEHDQETAEFAKTYMEDHYPELTIGMNEPYQLTSDKEFTTPHHAGKRGLRAIEVEIRQDLLTDKVQQEEWATRLAGLFKAIRSHFHMDDK